ncbi:MAG: Uma2 family endonuclease [Cyanobacteria bacterium RI_101]|nr:Uma2 family endonuclease [Cyanobacteria bacterium RI_101]
MVRMPSPLLVNGLDAFLQSSEIEASPAWEFIQGEAQQKPMPTLFHSRLQRNLVNAINGETRDYEAIQELRCLVPPFSPVPDIAVVKSARLTDEDGPLLGAPDWLIEILSPDQNILNLQTKILHCLTHGAQLAWLIDIYRQQIWVWRRESLPLVYCGSDNAPTLDNLLTLTVNDVIAMTRQR